MQTTPNLPQPTPDMYQSLTSQYRAMGGAPFGQSQQINNPSTVLISSTSNSLMSASVKPSNQVSEHQYLIMYFIIIFFISRLVR